MIINCPLCLSSNPSPFSSFPHSTWAASRATSFSSQLTTLDLYSSSRLTPRETGGNLWFFPMGIGRIPSCLACGA